MYSYKTKGTCSSKITFDLEDGKLKNVRFENGCNGNLQGIGRLTENMDAETIMNKLSGIRCADKETSCPDQLSKAIKQALKK